MLWVAAVLFSNFIAGAVVIDVTTTLDALADDGRCSLREAVIAANTDMASGLTIGECLAGSGADTIVLQAETYNLTRPGGGEDQAETGDLDIIDALTIQGAGQDDTLIYGNDLDRVFHIRGVQAEFTVTLSDLIVSHGTVNGSGGGILSQKPLTLSSVTLFKNTAGDDGGGIYSGGDLAMTSCLVTDNLSEDDGAGIFIPSRRQVSIVDSRISGQSAGGTGGGIYSDGFLTVSRTTIELNQSVWGGGIHSLREMTITESTIESNAVLRWGGGLANEGIATVTNSTISGNSAPEYGGNVVNMSGGDMVLLHATISDGTSPLAEAVHNDSVVTITSSILAGNCQGIGLVSFGGNVESPGDSCNLTRLRDQRDVPANALLLSPLADNGGPTFTQLLGPGSVAIDKALDGACPSTDQRGVIRPQDGNGDLTMKCDSGALEVVGDFIEVSFADGFESGDTSAWSSTLP